MAQGRWILAFFGLVVVAFTTSSTSTTTNSSEEGQDDSNRLEPFENEPSNLIFPEVTEYKSSLYRDVLYTYHYNTYREWNDAFWFCRDSGGELASILSRSQQKVIQKLLKKPRNVEEFHLVWLGASARNDCAWRWRWPDVYQPILHEVQHDIDYTYLYANWDTQDGSHEPRQECVALSNDPFWVFGKWRTDLCDQLHAFICQFDHCQRLSHTPQCSRTKSCFVDDQSDGGCRRKNRKINFVASTV